MVGQGIAIVAFTLIPPVMVVYTSDTLGASDTGFGAIVAIWAAGGVIGGLVFALAKDRSPAGLIAISTGLIGVAYLGMSATDQLWIACVMAILGGIGNGVQWVSVVTMLQEITPNALQARVLVILEAVASVATGIGFVAGGALTSLAEPSTALLCAGLAAVAVAAATPFALRTPTPV